MLVFFLFFDSFEFGSSCRKIFNSAEFHIVCLNAKELYTKRETKLPFNYSLSLLMFLSSSNVDVGKE